VDAHLLASLADEAVPLGIGAGGLGALVALVTLLVRTTSSQGDGWQVLVAAAEKRARAAEARNGRLEHDIEEGAERARECASLLASAQQLAQSAQERATAAEQRAVAAEGRADLLGLQLDEVRRRLAELERPS
jgi:uncharacterized protein (DUF3084 family)